MLRYYLYIDADRSHTHTHTHTHKHIEKRKKMTLKHEIVVTSLFSSIYTSYEPSKLFSKRSNHQKVK